MLEHRRPRPVQAHRAQRRGAAHRRGNGFAFGNSQRLGGVEPFLTPGYGLVDLTGYVNLSKNLRLAGGVFNIFDKKYWQWNNVGQTGLTANSPSLDRYTQPGINVAVNLQLIY